jgi:hypothetical protein
MRYISILITLALIAGMTIWYMKSGALPASQGDITTPAAPQQVIKQAQESTQALQQTLDQQQKLIEQQK